MAKKLINIGITPNDRSGDPLRVAFAKINENFGELYETSTILSPTAPTTPTEGNVWFNTSNNSLNIYHNGQWIEESPNLGNLSVADQTISGNNINGDIVLAPNGSGVVSMPGITLPVGSVIEQVLPSIEVIVADLILDNVVRYSTSDTDNLYIGDYGLSNGITGGDNGWCIYQFTTIPLPILVAEDIISGVNIPLFSNIIHVGTGIYSNIIITDKTIPYAVPMILPIPGETIFTVRPIINASLALSTVLNTDIGLVVGSGGRIITSGTIAPIVTESIDLGTPTKRFRRLWMGAGSIYVADETLGIDLKITARDGNLVIAGGAGMVVGEFTLRDNTIQITNPARDIIIGSDAGTGYAQFNRPLKVVSAVSGNPSFVVDRSGMTTIGIPNLEIGQTALSITAEANGDSYTVPQIAGGSLIHVTNKHNIPPLLTLDSFGDYAPLPISLIGRRFRGNVLAPQVLQAGDQLLTITAAGYSNSPTVTGLSQVSSARMLFVSDETFSATSQAGHIEFLSQKIGGTGVEYTGLLVNHAGITIPSISQNGTGLGGITFADSTIQTTAWTGTTTTANFGNIQISGDTIIDTVPGNEMHITTSDNGGGVTITADHLRVATTANNFPLFSINQSGTIDINIPSWSANAGAAVSIDASPGTGQIASTNAGVVLQLTGLDGTPSRIYNDGAASFPTFCGRRYNGTTESPSGVLSGDIIARFGANAYLDNNVFPSSSTARLDFVSTATQTSTNYGNHIEFWTTPNGSTAISKYLTVSDLGITFSDGTSQNTAAIPMTYFGTALGVATLDNTGKVSAAQLPTGAVIYKGSWDASNNSPSLANSSGTSGWEYSVNHGGSVDFGAGLVTFVAGDYVIYNGSIWQQIPSAVSVASFNGRTGSVALTANDVTTVLTYTPYNATINANGYVNAAGASAAAPVQSVFGRHGAITLTTSDVTNVLSAGTISNTMLSHSSLTIGTTTIALGATSLSLAGLSSISSTAISGTLQTSSQPNITSIGTLTNLYVTNLVSTAALSANKDSSSASTTGLISSGILSYADTGMLASFSSSTTGYNQLILQNTSTASGASTNLIVSNNLGTATAYYGQLGMNSSTFSGTGSFNIAGAVYLSSASTDLSIGTISSNSIHFVTNNSITDAMTINPMGIVTVTHPMVSSITGNSVTVTNGVYTTDTGTITNTMLAGSIANAKLLNSSLTVNGTLVSLGGTYTITAAASTLTGTTLATGVVNSSLTSVGTLTNLTVTNAITGSITGNAATVTNGVYTTGTYADPTWLTSIAGTKITGFVANATNATNATNASTVTNGVYTTGTYVDPTWISSIAGTKITGFVANATNATNSGTVTNGVYTTGTYVDPTWISSIAGSKITGYVANATNASTVTNGVYTTGTYADPIWITSLAYSKLTGSPTTVSAFTNDLNYITNTNFTWDHLSGIPTTIVFTTDTSTVTNTMLAGSIANSKLLNSGITVTAGTGMSGGGSVALGGTVTLTNAGVTSAIAGSGVGVSNSTGAVTITNTGVLSINGSAGVVTNIATLTGGYLSTAQIPPSLLGGVVYKGTWAATPSGGGSPTLANDVGTTGWEYVCTTSGTVTFGAGNITFYAGDFVIYDGSTWARVPTASGVTSFNTRTGSISLVTSDVTAVLTSGTVTNTMLVSNSLTINGVAINLGASGTITAAASTLTGTVLNSTVMSSSLTSVGTLSSLTVTASIIGSITGNAGTATILQNSHNINGVAFNGSSDITVHTAGTGIGITGTQINNSGVLSINGNTGVLTGIVTTGDTGTVTNTMLAGSIANTKLLNSSITVTAGTGMSGGGSVALGGTVTLTNAGVTSIAGSSNIAVTGSTGSVTISAVNGFQSVVTGNNASAYTILATDQYVGSIHSTTGATAITLPLGSGVTVGRQYVIKDEGGNAGNGGRRITITANGSDLIDGAATRTITSNYGALTIIWTGTKWSVI